MRNQNFLKLKRINEERLFRNDRELYLFVLKMRNQTSEQFLNSAERFPSVLNEVLIPLDAKKPVRTIRVGNFICTLSEGNFHRKSGDYKYNLLVTGRTDSLTGNDLKKLFNY